MEPIKCNNVVEFKTKVLEALKTEGSLVIPADQPHNNLHGFTVFLPEKENQKETVIGRFILSRTYSQELFDFRDWIEDTYYPKLKSTQDPHYKVS